MTFYLSTKGTDECPVRSVVNRVAVQLAKALQNKGMALLVNHGISEEKVDSRNHFSWIFEWKLSLPAENGVLALGRLLQAAGGHEGALLAQQWDGQPRIRQARPGALRWTHEGHATRLQHLHAQLEAPRRGERWRQRYKIFFFFSKIYFLIFFLFFPSPQPLPGFREHIAELSKDLPISENNLIPVLKSKKLKVHLLS